MENLGSIVIPLGSVGYQTDLPEQARGLTHYMKADNVIFEPGLTIRKFGGATKLNSTVVTGAPNIQGMFDFWFGGGASAFTQKFIAVDSNGRVYKEDMDGVFDDIAGVATITANAIPIFATAGNLLIIAFSTRDTILKWNGTDATVSTLTGAPLGKGCIYHAGRLWIWDGSTLYYSGYGNVEDWTSTDSGKMVIDDGDGDEIVGAAIYKESLIIFKGPNNGSIHPIYGRSPASFERGNSISGIPIQSHNAIVRIGDDIAFMSPRGVHLLSAVQQYGNYAEMDITRFLKRHFRDYISRSNLTAGWAVNYVEKSCLLWATTKSGGSENNQMFGLSYARLQEDGWKPFTVTRDCFSMALRKHPSTRVDELVTGGTDGFIRRQDLAGRNIDDTPYTMNLTTPRMLYATTDAAGVPKGDQPGVLEDCYLRSESVGAYSLTAMVRRDNHKPENYLFNLGSNTGTAILPFTLPAVLGGTKMEVGYSNPPLIGECRAVQFTLIQSGLDQDAKLIELGFKYKPISQSGVTATLTAE